jgi:hypothetical protein
MPGPPQAWAFRRERMCDHAKRFADGLRHRGYDVLNEVVIDQVLVFVRDIGR